jgi:hypothetical protein
MICTFIEAGGPEGIINAVSGKNRINNNNILGLRGPEDCIACAMGGAYRSCRNHSLK